MPLTRSAIKKLRVDKNRTEQNKKLEDQMDKILRQVLKSKNPKLIIKTISFVDKSVKKNIIHKNKAARIKSRLAKLVKTEKSVQPTAKKSTSPKKKTTKK